MDCISSQLEWEWGWIQSRAKWMNGRLPEPRPKDTLWSRKPGRLRPSWSGLSGSRFLWEGTGVVMAPDGARVKVTLTEKWRNREAPCITDPRDGPLGSGFLLAPLSGRSGFLSLAFSLSELFPKFGLFSDGVSSFSDQNLWAVQHPSYCSLECCCCCCCFSLSPRLKKTE